jgi:hypothetical protein
MELIKKIGGLCFAFSFVFAALLFVKISPIVEYKSEFKTAFLIFGALGMALNLLSYNNTKQGNSLFNFVFWFGAIAIFFGIVFKMLHYPYHSVMIIAGIFISASSFVISKFYKGTKKDDSDLVDQL